MQDKLTLLITDTHFGVKANSLTWLREQLEVFEMQIIPFLEESRGKYKHIEIVHCGDLFDSRSSISPYIMYYVSDLLRKLCAVCDEMIVIGGNHDYYSPNESSYNINSLDLLPKIDNLHLVTQTYMRRGKNLYIPWFSFENKETLEYILKENPDIKNIFCHTDLERVDDMILQYCLISGHIHKPSFSENKYNLGSLYPLTFADSNQDRFFYAVENDDMSAIKAYANECSIKFWRFYGKDILDCTKDNQIDRMDQVELYVDKDCLGDAKYQEVIEMCNKEYNTSIIVIDSKNLQNVPIDKSCINNDYDITQICDSMMPKRLQQKFQKIKKMLII